MKALFIHWFSVTLLAVSFLLLAKALWPLLMWGVSSTWVPVPARLVDVQVTSLQTPEERSRSRRALYTTEVIYRYDMAGQTWTSKNWGWYTSLSGDLQSGGPVFDRFRAAKGNSILAWVNPHDPSKSVLRRQPVWVVDLFRLGGAGIALVLYLVVQMLSSPANQQARVQAMATLALKTASAFVLVFASALVLDDQMGHQPSWQFAAGALAFSAIWVWGPLQILKRLGQQQPIMNWRKWRAPLPAFVNPHTRLNEFQSPPAGVLPSQAAVQRAHALWAVMLVAVGAAGYNAYRPQVTPSVPTGPSLHGEAGPRPHFARVGTSTLAGQLVNQASL